MKSFFVNTILFLTLFIFHSCDSDTNEEESTETYSDGEYCAEIETYYSKTRHSATYTLKVEVEDDELTKIFWTNQSWLDDSHFSPVDISDGSASFESDKGVEYQVKIIGKESGCNYSTYRVENKEEEKDTDEICSKCGNEKYSWEKFCRKCLDKIENTCSKCGAYEYMMDDNICSDCKTAREKDNEYGSEN